ncbi:MAG: hypothetical protein ACWGHH_07685 [Sulfurovaceae bacterium]
MELDGNIIISLVALGISLYNLYNNVLLRSIEKRTIVLNELTEAKLLIMQSQDAIGDIENIKTKMAISDYHKLKEFKSEFESMTKSLDFCFDKIMQNDKHDSNSLETFRPLIIKISAAAKHAYSFVNKLKKDTLKVISVYEKET